MSRLRGASRALIARCLFGCAWTLCACEPEQRAGEVEASQRSALAPVELRVLLDVSGSLQPEEVEGEASATFRYLLEERRLPPGSRYKVYIADRDIERNLVMKGQAGQGAVIYPVVAGDEDGAVEVAEGDLVLGRDLLKKRLLEYVQRYPEPRQRQTCLIRALASLAPRLAEVGGVKRVLFISDMEEDCDDGSAAEPRTRTAHVRNGRVARPSIDKRLETAIALHPLSGFEGVELEAVFPLDNRAPRIADLREPWTAALKPAGFARLRFDTLDGLLE